jgi:hypothetical protein
MVVGTCWGEAVFSLQNVFDGKIIFRMCQTGSCGGWSSQIEARAETIG